jgi:hypothetical protein
VSPSPENFSNANRPLQMVHVIDDWAGTTEVQIRSKLRRLMDAGLGGIVANVSLKKYLLDEEAWDVLRLGVRVAHEEGLRVWIYDEEGYPSGAAGGRVLEQAPLAEAQGLIRTADETGTVRYQVITLYEATHATENFYKKRHYINILDPLATKTFIDVTHERYARVLDPIDRYVEAFFTDEPSLINAYVPKDREYPRTLPWHPRVPGEFLRRKGYDLLPHRESLFLDTGPIDRKIRCDFYEVIADLCAETYFGGLQEWCREHRVASSGHLLGEETMVWQTDFDGDPFTCYRKFDIPGIDMILSDPEKMLAKDYFMVPKVAGSAARLQGSRRLMCEISDFFGVMDKKHATIEQMQCTAGILYSCGVTDLCSYYTLSFAPDAEVKPMEFPISQYRRWTEFARNLNALFAGGTIRTRVAVLYPLVSLWAHFTPSNRSMYEPHPNADVCFLDSAFTDLCRSLLQQQIYFDVVDERSLSSARVEGKTLVSGDRRYDALVLPPADTVRLATMEKITRFAEAGGSVFAHPLLPKYAAEGPDFDGVIVAAIGKLRAAGALGGSSPGNAPIGYLLRSRISPECDLTPSSPRVLSTVIDKAEGQVVLFVNVSAKPYDGICAFRVSGRAVLYDPATGEKRPLHPEPITGSRTRVKLALKPFESVAVSFQ